MNPNKEEKNDTRETDPWTPEERAEFEAYCRSRSMNPITLSGRESVDWLRKRRGLPPLPPLPPKPPIRWEPNSYSGMKSIADFEEESRPVRNAFGSCARPGLTFKRR